MHVVPLDSAAPEIDTGPAPVAADPEHAARMDA
jgi:hypothetical protein